MNAQSTQSNAPQGYPPQGNPRGYQAQGYPPQGYPPQVYPPQVYPPQVYPPQGYPPQGYHAQGRPFQGHLPQGYQAQGYPPQGYQAQGYPPQGYQAQGHPFQGNLLQGYLAQSQPFQGNLPQSYPPQAYQAPGQPVQGHPPQGYQAQVHLAHGKFGRPSQGNHAQGYAHAFSGNQPPYYGDPYSHAHMKQPFNPACGDPTFSGPTHHVGPANNPYPDDQAPGSGFQGSYDSSNNSQQQFGFAQTANPATNVHGNPSNPRGPGGEPAVKTARLSAVFAETRDQAMQSGADAEEDQKRHDRIEAMDKEIAYNDVLIAQVQKIKDGHESMIKNMNKAWEDDANATFEECKETFNAIKRVLFKNQ
ncbi:hypothetical protein KC343_g734 [Hortaea werneckii]|nr:hypothetical protein KC352_g4500 [Hortaea werneckii]KAI7572426.1 hypothetical protein KC317_g766 [Hortaea werneckii]KAI7627501.1 hypothetical protein KC346_g717 [Hortaea werneckii]KAI7637392.1 hypothetical protein KC343_g734 [Hortaea werneckii]KAI7683095.1 hypothetical protein KC319_g636 [Hortaea werneckii]